MHCAPSKSDTATSQFGWIVGVAALAVLLATSVRAQESSELASPEEGIKAAERALDFLVRDAVKWREERKCSTCHHGTMTVWGLTEARRNGYAVDAAQYSDILQWTKQRTLERIDLPRDTRPGWSMVNSTAIYLALLARLAPNEEVVSADELKRIRGHLQRHQEADGAWSWSSAPPTNRPPPFFESDEVATLLTCLALRPRTIDATVEDSERQAVANGERWLSQAERTDTLQAAVLRLQTGVQQSITGSATEEQLADVLKRQNADGGWGQVPLAASDAYATGQALYFLSLAGVPQDRMEVRCAVTFLVRTQQEHGAWPMKRRSHPGVTPSAEVVPINYFGAAWGTLGLVRSVPRP